MPIDMRLRNLESRARGLGENLRSQKAIVRGQGQLVMHESSLDVDVSIRTSEILNRISYLESHVTTIEDDVAYLQDQLPVIVRITSINSPYAIVNTNVILFCNTDGGAITVTLIPGGTGDKAKIINCGSSANDVTVTPNSTEELYGAGLGVSSVLSDGEVINIHRHVVEGWW
jgi:hypothetical protein